MIKIFTILKECFMFRLDHVGPRETNLSIKPTLLSAFLFAKFSKT
jgi:hypothetical protein